MKNQKKDTKRTLNVYIKEEIYDLFKKEILDKEHKKPQEWVNETVKKEIERYKGGDI